MTTYHRGIAAVGSDLRRPPGRQGFVQYIDGTTLWFKNVDAAERYAKGGPKPSDGEQVPAGEGYCTVPGCTSPAGSPCPKFIPGATATLCNSCNHLKSEHTGRKAKGLDFKDILANLT